jgi:hypothetical protein
LAKKILTLEQALKKLRKEKKENEGELVAVKSRLESMAFDVLQI